MSVSTSSVWQPGTELMFKYEGQVVTGMPATSTQYSGIKILCTVRCQVAERNKIYMKVSVRVGHLANLNWLSHDFEPLFNLDFQMTPGHLSAGLFWTDHLVFVAAHSHVWHPGYMTYHIRACSMCVWGGEGGGVALGWNPKLLKQQILSDIGLHPGLTNVTFCFLLSNLPEKISCYLKQFEECWPRAASLVYHEEI